MAISSTNDNKWLAIYVVSSWLCNIGHGLMITVVGPTQPYLAQKVGVDIDVINLVWTFGFAGYFVGSMATGAIFKHYFRSEMSKMCFLTFTIGLNGVMMDGLPFISNFVLLIVYRFLQNLLLLPNGKTENGLSLTFYPMGAQGRQLLA